MKIWNISSEACKKVTVNTPFKELKGHSGWVMGISWDTLGRVYIYIYIVYYMYSILPVNQIKQKLLSGVLIHGIFIRKFN